MKKILLLLLLSPFLGLAQAIPAGTYIIGASQPVPYKSLVTAIARVNSSGISGPVTFLLDENQTVTSQITIDEFTGSSTTNTLTIKPNVGKDITINANMQFSYTGVPSVFRFNGTSNVIIDGSNSSTNTKNLTLINNDNLSYTARSIIWVASNGTKGSSNITVKNSILKFTNRNQDLTLLTGVYSGSNTINNGNNFIDVQQNTATNSNIIIENNEMINVKDAININGNSDASKSPSGWKIRGNKIGSTIDSEKPIRGMYISNAISYEISGNTISGVRNNLNQTFDRGGIILLGTSSGIVSSNYINNITNTIMDNGEYYTAGIYANSTGITEIYNNMINNVYITSGDSSNDNHYFRKAHGIIIRSGSKTNIYYNTIVMDDAPASTAYASCLYITGGANISVLNNIFVNRLSNRQYAVFKNGGTISSISNNDYYVTNATNTFANRNNSIEYIGNAGFALWNAAVSDSNSKSVLPTFVSATDLHLQAGTVNDALKAGTPISITTDIDGEIRAISPDKPYMGADELCSIPAAAGTITGTATVCLGQTNVSYSVPLITNATSYVWSYSGTGATITNGTTRTPTIAFASNATSGILIVKGKNNCGEGTVSANYNITVNPGLSNNNLTYGTSVQVNATATEVNNVVLNAPSGSYFYTVNFASYGTPSGTAPNFIVGSCHASTSQSVTEGYVLGNSTVTIPASNGVFGDPCSGTTKSLYVSATYTQPVCSGTSVTITGSTPTGGNGTYTYEWQSSTTGAAGSFTAAPGTNNTINYTSGPLSQNTYFRRVVTSCTYSSTSTVVFVKLNPDINNNNLSYSSGTSGQLNATPVENANAVLNAPAGTYFATVNFASYGTPSGASPNFIIGGCHSTTSQTVTEGYLLGNSTATIPATNAVFGDPCNGTGKRLYVLATYVQPVCSGTSVTITGTTPTGGNGIYTYVWQSSTTSATSGFAPISGTNTINYTSGALTQTTWFRRVVTSCSSTSTSPVVMVVVNTLPSKPTIGTKTNPTCTVPTGSVVLNGLPSSGSWTITATPNASGLAGLTGTGTTTTITGLTAGTSYTFAVSNGTCVSSPSEDVVATPLALVTWNGTDWLPGNPTVNNRVEFNGNYSSGSTVKAIPNVDACSCQIKNNAVVVFNAGHTLKVVNELQVVAGTLTFEDDASLVQVNDAAINSGNIIYKRKTTPVNRFDFTYWSSPVRDMTLGDPPVGLSPTTFYDKYFIYNNAWVSVPRSTVMLKGEGYSVRAPQTTAISGNPLPFLATFTGVPHNGEVKKMLTGNGVYLIGNPYPSAIDADQFLALNSSVLQGTLYFWTHNSPPSDAVAGDKKYNYTTNDYATYNRTGGTGAKAAITGGLPPSGKIASAQGFFAPASVAGGELVFNNAMRLSTTGTVLDNTQFFKLSTNSKTAKTTTANTEKNRIWLNLTNSEGAFKQTLIGYVTGATNDYDGAFDGVTYDGNQYVDFYSVNNEVNLSIQGRALPFVKKDSVALGYKSTIKGEFQISIDQTDGVLVTQNVFLEDKDLKVIHDLKKASYTFSTEKGAFNNRFVLRYADKNATDEVIVPEVPGEESNAAVIVSVKEGEIKINATVTKLDKVVVYDMAGRKLFQKNKVDANVFFISRLVWNHQALVVDIVLADGTKHSRKIIN